VVPPRPARPGIASRVHMPVGATRAARTWHSQAAHPVQPGCLSTPLGVRRGAAGARELRGQGSRHAAADLRPGASAIAGAEPSVQGPRTMQAERACTTPGPQVAEIAAQKAMPLPPGAVPRQPKPSRPLCDLSPPCVSNPQELFEQRLRELSELEQKGGTMPNVRPPAPACLITVPDTACESVALLVAPVRWHQCGGASAVSAVAAVTCVCVGRCCRRRSSKIPIRGTRTRVAEPCGVEIVFWRLLWPTAPRRLSHTRLKSYAHRGTLH
jgi:hypothetical protein